MYVIEPVINYLSLILPILISVAMVTLLERKILGLSQLRLGPNTVMMAGLLQPFADAVKFISKQFEYNTNANSKVFIMSPAITIIISMVLWNVVPVGQNVSLWNMSMLMFITIMSMGVYPILLTGWSSNSNYAIMGSLRGVAQTISYEISFGLIVMIMLQLKKTFDMSQMLSSAGSMIYTLPSFLSLWMVMTIAEANRTPFDFSEGESELVSGFNVEYASVGFVMIFLSEYAMLVLFGTVTSALVFSTNLFSIVGSFTSLAVISVWIIIRGTLPRFRYDLLMNLAWKSFLPISLGLLALVCLY